MPIVVDSQNLVRTIENAPDGLRAEIGSYYSPPVQTGLATPSGFVNFRSNIDKSIVTQLPTNQQVLTPVKKPQCYSQVVKMHLGIKFNGMITSIK